MTNDHRQHSLIFDAPGWYDTVLDHHLRAADAVYRGYDRVPIVIPWTALPLPGEKYAQERTALLKVMIWLEIEDARRKATEIRDFVWYLADLDELHAQPVVANQPRGLRPHEPCRHATPDMPVAAE
jgi:hypothetical protein